MLSEPCFKIGLIISRPIKQVNRVINIFTKTDQEARLT